MIAEAADFAAECEATYALLKPLEDADYGRQTQFKSWTINGVMQHLYTGDMRAHLTLTDPEAYARVKAERQAVVATTTAQKLANQRKAAVTARLMETWSHSQALYDVLGAERADGDRIRAIAHLGAITYGWTFVNRSEDPPGPAPLIRLTAPSGAIWEWNAETAPQGRA